jgi:hypothetical protein
MDGLAGILTEFRAKRLSNYAWLPPAGLMYRVFAVPL